VKSSKCIIYDSLGGGIEPYSEEKRGGGVERELEDL
jgi:hypothetical protein